MASIEDNPIENGGTPGPTPAPAPASPPTEQKSVLQAIFPTQTTLVMVIAILIGLLLIVGGFAAKVFVGQTTIQANIVLAIGAGILLAAFGGQANAKFGSFVLAGVVAITAFFLFWLERAERIEFERQQSTLVSGRITGVNLKLFKLSLQNAAYAYARNDTSVYDFVIPKRDLHNETTHVTVELIDKAGQCPPSFDGEDCTRLVLVPRAKFEGATPGTPVEWRFNVAKGALFDLQNNEVSLADASGPGPARAVVRLANPAAWLGLEAHAQEPLTVEDPARLEEFLTDLTDNDIETRRLARDELSKGPLSWVKPIADRMTSQFDVYRVKLGCAVAFAQMLRLDKERRLDVQKQLSPEHLAALLKGSADSDRTVRIYASEFLFDLGDPRTVHPALEMAAATGDDNARFNLILVVRGGIGFLEEAERRAALEKLRAMRPGVGDKTKKQIDMAIKQATS